MATLSIVPGKLDLEFYGGDDVRFVAKFKRVVDVHGNNPVYEYYLPTGDYKAMIRDYAGCSTGYDLVVTKDETDLENPFIAIEVPSEVSAALVVGQPLVSQYFKDELVTAPMFIGVWDLQVDNDGDVRTYLFGKVTALGEVTR